LGFIFVIREPRADTAEQFSSRMSILGALYSFLFCASIAGLVLIVHWAHLLVTLTQRSNIETLTLLFFMAFYVYFALLSWRGALGACWLLWYGVIASIKGEDAAERRKADHMSCAKARHSVALNMLIERDDVGAHGFELRVGDATGELGVLEIDGARMTFHANYKGSSSELFIYVVHQINKLLRLDLKWPLDIVEWEKINGETLEQYVAMVEFARNLARSLNARESWPRVTITEADCRVLESRISEICPALRSETLLPQWEYSGDHKLPLIPEPLGLFSLGVSEKRVDPIASIGAATAIVTVTVLAILLIVLIPPWVPG
jgi:hypothetical protein